METELNLWDDLGFVLSCFDSSFSSDVFDSTNVCKAWICWFSDCTEVGAEDEISDKNDWASLAILTISNI